MDVGYFSDHAVVMTVLVVLAFLLLLAVAGPVFGADTRSSRGWASSDPDGPLWSDAGFTRSR